MARRLNRVAVLVALGTVAVGLVAIGIVTVGVLVVGEGVFDDLMAVHGVSASASADMFDAAVGRVFALSAVIAVAGALLLAAVLARWIVGPLGRVAAAAEAMVRGDYTVRADHRGPREVAAIAGSFNALAAAIQEQERQRSQLVQDFAHELRTPLTNIRGYIQALRDGVLPRDEETLRVLAEEVDRLVRLSRSLDTLTANEVGPRPDPRSVDVAAAVRAAVRLFAAEAEAAGLELVDRVAATPPVLATPDLMAQVLGNLLQNAVRYTPAGGVVTITASDHAGRVRVAVTNSGATIPREAFPHLFRRFFRVAGARDRASGGAGIGLAIVRELVSGAGGDVGVQSADGSTTFWLTLPTVPARADRPAPAPSRVR